MKDHFQSDEIVKFELKDGSQFGYKPMTAGEENDCLPEYMEDKKVFDKNTGKYVMTRVENLTKINKVRSYNLLEAPYTDWEKKTKEERWKILCSLRPDIFSEIFDNINKINNGDSVEKKNSSQQSTTATQNSG